MTHHSPVLRLLFRVLLAAVLAAAGIAPAAAQVDAPDVHLLADAADTTGQAWLVASGAEKLVEYGEFSLWGLPTGGTQALAAVPAGLQPVSTRIWLRDITLDTTQVQAEPPLPDSLQAAARPGEQFWIVQFAGPVVDEWLEALLGAGLQVVAYLPENAFVVWGDDPAGRIGGIAQLAGLVQWHGAYHPAYRLEPGLREAALAPVGAEVDVTVQVFVTPRLDQTVADLTGLATAQLAAPNPLLNLVNLRLRLPESSLAGVSARPDVFNVEPYRTPVLLDEIQAQVLSGNIAIAGGKTTAAAPGYLAWLASKGFPQNASAYPIVDVIDDGIDAGDAANVQHPDFFTLGVRPGADRIAYLANCTTDATPDGGGGHGNLNAGILGGYNNLAGFPYENAAGYQYGLGISPYGPLAGTKIFRNSGAYDISQCAYSDSVILANAYLAGARLTSDSWGAPVKGAYDASAQEFDLRTRDASASLPGNQAMLHVFAAGNEGGGGSMTISSPGTAKNVLTVGAAENPRDHAISCNGWTDADSADDIAPYSSRGTTADGRAKPDLVAPGTHVSGPATQDPDYSAGYVCVPYYPAGQALYTWSTGTSHSTPAIAGAAQLAYEYYGRALAPGQAPSPAMLKALLLNAPRYLTGLAANDTLPGAAQGWGMLDMGRLFDDTPRLVFDQNTLLAGPGATFTFNGSIADSTRPLRVSLVWTDAPGSIAAGQALVNNLNLEVTAGGVTYRGNQFDGASSVAGDSADTLNNVENVFLPAGLSGGLQVKVTAANLPGDGVPGNGDSTDQDFALVIYNGSGALSPNLSLGAVRWYPVEGNLNHFPEPGDTFDLEIDLANAAGSGQAANVSATLSVPQGLAAVLQPTSNYPNLPAGATGTNLLRFRLAIDPAQPCGGLLGLQLSVNFSGGSATLALPELFTALAFSASSYAYTGPPVPVPDYALSSPGVGAASLQIFDGRQISDLDVTVNVEHTFIGDLELRLGRPGGQEVQLVFRRGGPVDNYTDVTFDDEATRAIATSSAPFSGSYRPVQALSAFDGTSLAGTWTLTALDHAALDTGKILGFTLASAHYVCTAAQVLLPVVSKQ